VTTVLKKGTIITCPECGKHLLKVMEDLVKGMQIWPHYFEGIGYNYQDNPFRQCCNYYYRDGQFHTEDGWV